MLNDETYQFGEFLSEKLAKYASFLDFWLLHQIQSRLSKPMFVIPNPDKYPYNNVISQGFFVGWGFLVFVGGGDVFVGVGRGVEVRVGGRDVGT